MQADNRAGSLPQAVILGGSLILLGSALSEQSVGIWVMVGKLVWYIGYGLGLCSALGSLRRQGRWTPILNAAVLGLLVIGAGFVMISLWYAGQNA
ncbi:hypothetical protein [Deinococcus hohokamensis]|uniref:Uncharacterized protein n=1 Tax=Deinococcus hohokamensis TaxID=309883 RepID=A0ABV9IDH6_9DEIO